MADRIEKKVLLKAPRAKVWRAIADAQEFGKWFQAKLESPFTPGAVVRGHITTKGHEGLPMELAVERVEPERLLSLRWHPYAIEPGVDYSHEPTTLIEFVLEEAPGGTMLTITESGFDQIPIARRAKAFQMNDMGWGMQAENIRRHVEES
jgi:uncharacterized protein YndB with AHSA1/START domain